jgi:hypothetical protein
MANLIAMKLSAAGYRVFVDIETLRAGKFNERLLEVIEECKDFILVLPPNALDRCANDDDWVRREVEHAIKHKRNIIPVMLRDFQWPSSDALPEGMRDLPLYNGITIADANLFVENIERLKRAFLISRPQRRAWRIALYAIISIAFVVVLFVLMGRKSDDANVSKSASDGTPTAESADKLSPEELRICDEYATQLINLYMLSDSNMQLLDKTYKDWNRKLVKDKPTDENKRDFKSNVAMNRQQLHKIPSMTVFASDYAVLEKVGIYAKDIERFESSIKELHGELEEHFYTLESIASSPNLYGEYIEISQEYYLAILEYNYCILLEMFSKMPKSVYDTVYDVTIALEFFTEKSMHYPTEEYQRMQKSLKNTIESKRRAMSGMVDNE